MLRTLNVNVETSIWHKCDRHTDTHKNRHVDTKMSYDRRTVGQTSCHSIVRAMHARRVVKTKT